MTSRKTTCVDRLSPAASTATPSPQATTRTPKPLQLDTRLRAAADWVTPCETCADIGCDHGRLGAALLLENRCKHLLSADVSAKALAKAQTRLTRLGYGDRAFFVAADGLNALDALPNKKADTICILGMGGDTIAGILLRGASRLHGATLVLGAQTELFLARSALQQIGYRLTDERVVTAEGRLYLLMRAAPAPKDAPAYTEQELWLGPKLLAELPAQWKPWLLRKEQLLAAAIDAMQAAHNTRDAKRLAAAQRELAYTQAALHNLAEKYQS